MKFSKCETTVIERVPARVGAGIDGQGGGRCFGECWKWPGAMTMATGGVTIHLSKHPTVYFKCVNFIVWKSYLKKADNNHEEGKNEGESHEGIEKAVPGSSPCGSMG